jgi:sRNA-binding protein
MNAAKRQSGPTARTGIFLCETTETDVPPSCRVVPLSPPDRRPVKEGEAMLLSEDTPTTQPAARRRNLAAVAAITLLAETWPACFSVYEGRRRPLKLGIHHGILAVLDGAITPRELKNALRHYVGNRCYLRRLITGAPRIDLDGNPAGVVTAEEAAAAAAKLAAYAAAAKQRRLVAAPPAPTPEPTQPAAPRRISLADLREAARLRKAQEAVHDHHHQKEERAMYVIETKRLKLRSDGES